MSECKTFETTIASIMADTTLSDAEKQTRIMAETERHVHATDAKEAKQLGVVYTPVEIVDFINASINDVLMEEFGVGIGDESVQVLDPFTGTGVFPARLIQSDLISDEDITRNVRKEIKAFEIMPDVADIAAKNISNAHKERTGIDEPFEGVEVRDTFSDE